MLYKQLGFSLFGILFSFQLIAKEQRIESVLSASEVLPGGQVELTLRYTVTDEAKTTGLGFQIFFNSDKLTDATLLEIMPLGKVSDQFQDDTSNQDDDPNTDRLLNVAWADPFSGQWPSASTFPLTLLKLSFQASDDFDGSQINYRVVSKARGYDFIAPSITIAKALDSNNDIDGLTSGNISLTPQFSTNVTNYTANVSFVNDTVSLTPTISDTASFLVLQDSNPISAQNIPLSVGINNLTIRVTAENGDSKDYTFEITRQPALSISFESVPEGLNSNSRSDFAVTIQCNLSNAQVSGTITDTETIISLSPKTCTNNQAVFSNLDASTLNDGNINLVLTAQTSDESNQINKAILLDTQAPSLNTPESITLGLTEANTLTPTDPRVVAFANLVTATDALSSPVTINYTLPETIVVGQNVVRFIATDAAGNVSTAESSVLVTDQGQPSISAQGGVVAATDANGVAKTAAAVQALLNAVTASDAIDGVLTVVNNAPATLSLGANTITLTATDSAGNTATQTMTITVSDQSKPVLTTPDNITVSATNNAGTAKSNTAIQAFLASATATDNVDTQVSVTNDAPATFPLGTTTVTFTATDTAGNTDTTQATITIADENAPTLTAPASITVAATDASGTAQTNSAIQAFLNGASATDNVTTELSITHNAPTVFPLGVTTVIFSVSDGQNTTTAQATVTVTDQGQPSISAQGGVVAATDANGVAKTAAAVQALLNAVTASDAIDGVLTVVNNAPATLSLGANTITLTATDSAGNTATQTMTITVSDQSKPVLTTPDNITVSATNNAGTAKSNTAIQAFLASATATDNVDTQVSVTNDAPATFPLGTTTVTFTATDTAGNTDTTQATITIADENAPTLTAPASITVAATDASGTAQTNSAIQAFLNGASATDNVTTELSITHNAPTVFPLGVTTVIFSVSDGINVSTQTSTVTVTDQTAPVFAVELSQQTVQAGSNGIRQDDPQIQDIVKQITATDNVDTDVAINVSMPTTLAIGENTVVATAQDNAGNAVQMSFVVVVQLDPTAPEITVPEDIVLDVLNPTDTISNTNSAIVDFVGQATAVDTLDGDLSREITHDLPSVLNIGSYTVTFSVTDSAGNTASDTAMIQIIIRDTDQDGMPDHVELSNGLDTNDPSDALLDLDGDGVTNLEEYESGTDLNVDDVAPVLTIPADIFTTATGKFTGVRLGQASATDVKDGELTPTPSATGPFASGMTEILWTVNDTQGNTASATQMLFITPLVSLTPDSISGEGNTIPITVTLSGAAVEYPVTITLGTSGTATDDDFNIATTELEIASGLSATTTLTVIDDNLVDSGEEIVISIISAQNAEIGSRDTRTITVLEENIAPIIDVVMTQNDMQTKTISQDGGEVAITVNINDVNLADTHTIVFDETTNGLLTAMLENNTLTFDPSALAEGVYEGSVTVTDNGVGELSSVFEFVYRVLAVAPELASDIDSDGDGISDAEEGLGDADNDGIPDYKDNIPEANLAPLVAGSTQVIEAAPGTTIALGKTVFAAGTDAVGLTEEQVEEVTGTQDSDFEYPSGLLDFVISGAKPGDSYRLVIPLGGPIPANAVFRKFSEANGWSDFVENANNSISSAMDIDGACPSLGSSVYQSGLNEGDTCLELLIEDGGANDTDGAVDGKVTDPSGIAIRYFGPPSDAMSSISISVSELFANSSDSSIVTVNAMDSDGRSLAGLSVSGQVVNGQLSRFVEQGNGVYTATYTAGPDRGVVNISVTLSNGNEQASLQTQITLKKRDSGGSTSWLYLGLLVMALARRVAMTQEKQ